MGGPVTDAKTAVPHYFGTPADLFYSPEEPVIHRFSDFLFPTEVTLEISPPRAASFTHAGSAFRSARLPSSGNANSATYAMA